MLKRTLAALLAAALLSGCAPLQMNIEQLIQPPRLSLHQSEIYNALESATGGVALRFKYPQSGEFRSAFVFRDLDGDGIEEAVVIYEREDESGSTWVNVLKNENGKWRCVSNIAGKGTGVDFISFASLTDPDREDMIIGWTAQGYSIKNLVVYSFGASRLEDIYSAKYSAMLLNRPAAQALDEMLILYINTSNRRAYARQIGFSDYEMDVVSDVQLAQGILSFPRIIIGEVRPGARALFIEQQLEDGQYSTSVVELSANGLVNLTPPTGNENDPTLRLLPVFSRDADGDGITEIPSARLVPGYTQNQEKQVLYFTDFLQYEDGAFRHTVTAAINGSASYMLTVPERWDEAVTIRPYLENRDWRFYEYDADSRAQSQELLRIKVYSQNDYRDKFELESMIPLGSKGLFEYFGFLPQNTGSYLEISREELLSMFSILE